MAWVAALIGAAGSIGGSLIGGGGGDQGRQPALPAIANNPLYQQLLLQSLIGTGGQISPATLRAGSPLGTLLGAAQSAGLRRRGQRGFSSILDNLYAEIDAGRTAGLNASQIADTIQQSGWWNPGDNLKDGALGSEESWRSVMDPGNLFGDGVSNRYRRTRAGKRALNRLSAASGYTSLTDLIQAQLDYEDDIQGRIGPANETADTIAEGRNEAMRRIAELQGGFVAPTEEELETRRSEIESILRAQIARDFGERETNALYQANAYGVNPAGQLGRLGEGRALAEYAAGPDSLARTLQLVAGMQGVQTNALTALRGSLTGQEMLPLALLGIQSGNQVSLANIAVNQALGLADLQSRDDERLGQGIQGGLNQLGLIPSIQAEQRRQNQIDSYYGIGSAAPTTDTRRGDPYYWGPDY